MFSFRDPQRRPAAEGGSGDRRRSTSTCPARSPEELNSAVVEPTEQALSSIAGIDEMHGGRSARATARITLKFVLERDINDAAQDVREKVAQAIEELPPEVAAADHHEGRPRRGSRRQLRAVGVAAAARADRDRRQADPARDRDRWTASARSPSAGGQRARDPRRPRHREAERARPHRRPACATRSSSENVEVPGGYIQQGDAELGAAHARAGSSRPTQFANIVVATTASGRRSGCRDVGRVEDTTRRGAHVGVLRRRSARS